MKKNIFRLYAFILIFAPLAFSCAESWSVAVLEFSICITFIVCLSNTAFNNRSFFRVPGLVPFFIYFAYIVIQCVPLPMELVKMISPARYDIFINSYGVTNHTRFIPLTLSINESFTGVFRMGSYFLFYILSVQVLSDKRYLNKTMGVLTWLVPGISFLAIIQFFLSPDKIYFFRSVPDYVHPVGPYPGRNLYAGFITLVFPLLLSVFFIKKPAISYLSFKEKVIMLVSGKQGSHYLIMGMALLVTALSVFTSLSRGGIVSLIFSVMVFSIMFIRYGKRREGTSLFYAGVILILVLGLFKMTGWEPVLDRFNDINDNIEKRINTNGRAEHWQDSLKIIKDFPLTGIGTGAFRNVHFIYREVEQLIEHAHNDYLELIAETGIIGFLLFSIFLLIVFKSTFKAFKQRRDYQARILYMGGFCGIAAIAVFSITDFNLQNPANGLYFAFLLSVLVAAANTRFQNSKSKTKLRTYSGNQVKIAFAPVTLFFVLCTIYNGRVNIGHFYFSFVGPQRVIEELAPKQIDRVEGLVVRAVSFDPLNYNYWQMLGKISRLKNDKEKALVCFSKALGLNPIRSDVLQNTALVYHMMGDRDRCEILLKSAVKYDPVLSENYIFYASWLFVKGEYHKALKNLKMAMILDDKVIKKVMRLLIVNNVNHVEVLKILPETIFAYMYYGDFLKELNRIDDAEDLFIGAMALMDSQIGVTKAEIKKLYLHYFRSEEYGTALGILRKGLLLYPDYSYLRFKAAQLYLMEDLTSNAEDEYRKILISNPGDNRARKYLSKLSNTE